MESPRNGGARNSVAKVLKPWALSIRAVSPPPQLRSRALLLEPASLRQRSETDLRMDAFGIGTGIQTATALARSRRRLSLRMLVIHVLFPLPWISVSAR